MGPETPRPVTHAPHPMQAVTTQSSDTQGWPWWGGGWSQIKKGRVCPKGALWAVRRESGPARVTSLPACPQGSGVSNLSKVLGLWSLEQATTAWETGPRPVGSWVMAHGVTELPPGWGHRATQHGGWGNQPQGHTRLEPWSCSELGPGPQTTHRGTTPHWGLTTGLRTAGDSARVTDTEATAVREPQATSHQI